MILHINYFEHKRALYTEQSDNGRKQLDLLVGHLMWIKIKSDFVL